MKIKVFNHSGIIREDGIFVSYFIKPQETFEEKITRMKMDIFKNKYPFWSNIDSIISKAKTGICIYKEQRRSTLLTSHRTAIKYDKGLLNIIAPIKIHKTTK